MGVWEAFESLLHWVVTNIMGSKGFVVKQVWKTRGPIKGAGFFTEGILKALKVSEHYDLTGLNF